MFFPVRTDCALRTTPRVNYALILVNVVVFALQKLEAGGAINIGFGKLALNPGEPTLLAFFSYAFMHGGYMHLIGNMVFLYIFGNNVSDRLGQVQYLLFYLAGGVFAGIGFVLLAEPVFGNQYAPVVGASGAVAAVTGAYLVLFPRSNVTVLIMFILIGFYQISGLWFVALFFAQDLLFQFFGAGGNVAHSAHISGSIFGFTVSMGLLATGLLERDRWDLLSVLSQWNRRREYRSVVATGWDPYGKLPSKSTRRREQAEEPPDPRTTQIMEMRAQVSEAVAHRDLKSAAELYLKLIELDPKQVMPKSTQTDIANQLASMDRFSDAVAAYESFLRTYPQAEDHAHIQLWTGLIYSRYLDDPQKAIERIEGALPRLVAARDLDLARSELERLRSGRPVV